MRKLIVPGLAVLLALGACGKSDEEKAAKWLGCTTTNDDNDDNDACACPSVQCG